MSKTKTKSKTKEKRATEAEQQLLRDLLLEQGFSMAQVRRAVRALTPGAASFTKEQLWGCRSYRGLLGSLERMQVVDQRMRDRLGIRYEEDRPDDVPFPRVPYTPNAFSED